jgi:hypothetical protein
MFNMPMKWLERNAWWGLVFMAVVIVIFGVTDTFVGPAADVAIPMSLTGLTLAELEAESPAAYRLFDFFTRVNGWSLVILGSLATAVLLFAYRPRRRWAWWTMWLLPAWSLGVSVFYVVAGLAPGQQPPPPMLSGLIFALPATAIQLLSARPFFAESP